MTLTELDELGRKDDITAEAIQMLLHDQDYFEWVFERATPFVRATVDCEPFSTLKPGEMVGP